MKTCDVCKDLSKPCSAIKVMVLKEENKKGEKLERVIITVSIDLCESDLDVLNQNIGNMIKTMRT